MAFRLSAIDRLPEPPSMYAAKGTLVHRALELLMWEEDPGGRTLEAALAKLERAVPEILDGDEFAASASRDEERAELVADAEQLIHGYFALEDPNAVRVIGTELRLSVQLGSLTLSGIIDRLELDDDGELVVTDYKTGRAPSATFEQGRLTGVHFYALLCEEIFGRRPARVQLLHLREPIAISTVPSEQSIRGMRQKTLAVWSAVELACEREDFRPRPGWLCDSCAYHEYCPAVGGDLSRLPSAVSPASLPDPPLARRQRSRRRMSPQPWRPPTVPIPSGVDRFDAFVDAWFDRHLRGRPTVDRVMYTASAVGDHGLIWLGLAAVQAVRHPDDWRRPLLRASAGLGIESALVNGPVKWMFRRTRPMHEGPRPRHLRQPADQQLPERPRHRRLLRRRPAARRRLLVAPVLRRRRGGGRQPGPREDPPRLRRRRRHRHRHRPGRAHPAPGPGGFSLPAGIASA